MDEIAIAFRSSGECPRHRPSVRLRGGRTDGSARHVSWRSPEMGGFPEGTRRAVAVTSARALVVVGLSLRAHRPRVGVGTNIVVRTVVLSDIQG